MLLDESTFFVDSCLGRRITERLKALGLKAVHHDELFGEGTEDIFWIPHVAALGYVILTKDKAIRRDSAERQAVIASKAIMLTYPKGNYTVDDMETIFVQNRLRIGRMLNKTPAPLIAAIFRGSVELRYPEVEK